jgi:hypothetical protein
MSQHVFKNAMWMTMTRVGLSGYFSFVCSLKVYKVTSTALTNVIGCPSNPHIEARRVPNEFDEELWGDHAGCHDHSRQPIVMTIQCY